jgi:hypothetical protein
MSWLSDLFGTSGSQQQLQQIASQQGALAGAETAAAGPQLTTGTALEQPLLTGKLPAPAQALVDQTLTSNLANLRNSFSRLGLTGSTMEASGLNAADLASLAQTFGIQEDMFKLGLSSIQEALGFYGGAGTALSGETGTINDIANLNLSETNDLMQAIASIAGAAGKAASAGGGSPKPG